jgi:hypothetical protein
MANTVASIFFGQIFTKRTVIGILAAYVNGQNNTAINI